ncbi:protein DENND6A-like [Clavelina lepadiformis]|uniref:protein DENND6A-like n=1 Tax=Clavelina lepadiformis TaxID=159417 RepID=UPI004041B884
MENELIEPDENEGKTLPWDQFSEWLHCIAVVTFDLELGQAMEFVYPKHIELSDTERTNICYLAFPDSNSGCMGDTQYCFRIRRSKLAKSHKPEVDRIQNKNCPVTLLKDKTHFYGYVYFRQVRDKTLKRGYFQKSVVLLSSLPYFNFFKDIVDIIAPEYFDNREPCLEAVCHDIDQWPCPIPGKTLSLPLMGMVLQVRIPTKQDKPGTTFLDNIDKKTSLASLTLSSINEVDLFESFQQILPHLHLIWELILLGEPLVVMATSPTLCASTVLAFISSISPLRYQCDYRPYFTIHDSEFKEYTTKIQDPPHVLLGVTNPFFAKTFQNWPHVVRLSGVGLPNYGGSNPSLLNSDVKLKKVTKLKALDQKAGVFTKYKPFLKKDKMFLKNFTKGLVSKQSSRVQSNQLKRHFLELTQSFVIPLERYMACLMPLQKNISALRAPPSIRPFRPEEFLQMVESNGPQLTSGTKGDWTGLYRQFLRSPNFQHWHIQRRLEMEAKVMSLHLVALSEMDLRSWCGSKSEVEVVDVVLRLKQKVSLVNEHKIEVSEKTLEKLNSQLTTIKERLPPDLQTILSKD